jgi:hypothetical protein
MKTEDGAYKLSKMTGSLRYMAPGKSEPSAAGNQSNFQSSQFVHSSC